MEHLTEQEILDSLKKMNEETLNNTIDEYNYQWDENESTSMNLRNLAECIFNTENRE